MTAAERRTRLIFIRHGETAWNAEGRIQGQLDVPLSPHGIWQAARLARRLEAEPIDVIVSSDLARASLTAQPLAAALGLPLQLEPRLRERHFGRFQGHTLEEVSTRWPQDFAAWRARDPAWAIPEGESAHAFIARVLAATEDWVQRHAGATLAIVAHGGVLDIVYREAQRLRWDAPREHPMLNASINRMSARLPLQLTIDEWGDVAHLGATPVSRDERAA